MRYKGIPTYTRHSVAWPDQPLHSESPSVYDEIGVSFDAKGGGTHGEFRFTLHRFGLMNLERRRRRGDDESHVAVHCFSDGLAALADERVQTVLAALRRRVGQSVDAEALEELLRKNGIRPSVYHLQGEMKNASYDRRAEIPREIARLRRHESSA